MKNRVGETNISNQGYKMTIISYKKSTNIDIQFEDGSVVYNKNYSNFKKGLIKHPIRYEESIAHYIEVELGLNLDDIWNWEKNKYNPYEIYKCSDRKVWLYCQEHDYHNYDIKGNKIGYKITCNNFYNNRRCGYCNSFASHKVHWKDSLAYNYPQIARMIAIEENNLTFEDCYNISCYSEKNFYFKCNNCNKISTKKKRISFVVLKGYSCEICSDGISIPNKFMYNLLTQLNINFKSEYSPYYFRSQQSVDFLLTDYNIIIEMDGNYGNHTREYDYWRDFLNMKYGGYRTIRIDLKDDNKYNNDTLNYIKEQIIKSKLFDLFNLNNINWNHIWEQCQKSLCVKSWELWNNNYSILNIMNELDLSRSTIIKYLKRGEEINRCSYTKEHSLKMRKR